MSAPSTASDSAAPPGMAWPPPSTTEPAPVPSQAPSQAPSQGPSQLQPGRGPTGSHAMAPFRPSTADRPSALSAACLVAWITCGLAALVLAATGLVLLSVPDAVFDELRRQDPELLRSGFSESELRRLTLIGCAIGFAWCAAAITFAVAAFQGRRWGWIGLVVSAAISGVTSLVLLVGSLALIVTLAASAASLGLLLRPESREWCRRRPQGRGSVSP